MYIIHSDQSPDLGPWGSSTNKGHTQAVFSWGYNISQITGTGQAKHADHVARAPFTKSGMNNSISYDFIEIMILDFSGTAPSSQVATDHLIPPN